MQLQIFNNPDFGDVRVIMKDGIPWFVAADVCRALEIQNHRDALSRLDDDEKGVAITDTLGGKQNMSIVNESGLYALTLTSRKPNAKKFRKWLTGEVVPSIFRTGSYSIQNSRPIINGNEIKLIGTMAQDIQSIFAVKRGIALSQAIDIVGDNYKLNFNSLKQLLPPAEHDTGYLNPTQIGERLGGLSAKAVNKMFAEAD